MIHLQAALLCPIHRHPACEEHFKIEKNYIEPSTDRAQGIDDYKAPTCKKGLQRFLGLINCDRLFVSNLSTKSKPLYRLICKGERFIWNVSENEIFNKIRMGEILD